MAQSSNLIERLFWQIKLRWIAVIGATFTISFARHILKLPLATFPLYALATFLAFYNLILFFILSRIVKKQSPKFLSHINKIANVQISLDLVTLTALIHFCGGIENPFIFYFIFQMINASILLSRRASFSQATFAVSLLIAMGILEYSGLLHHYCLKGFIPYTLHNNALYIFAVSFVFATTLYIAVYVATSISGKLRERESSLEEANRLLREKDQIKSEYVLRVSHNIKEHLSAIQSCIEPVTGGITGPLNERQMDLLRRADERTGKLLFFVKALLEITRIKLSKDIKMEYFSFKDILSDAISHNMLKARHKDISVNCTVEPGIDKIRGAKEYIEEAISNLLANSVKYSPRNGKIDIDIIDKGSSILIQIKDTGIGIPKDELPRIFDEFYRASNAKEVEKDGTGLGLSITRQVVERHDGKIWVESEEGKGSTFFVSLPK